MSRLLSGESKISIALCHASLLFIAPFGIHGISPKRVQVHLIGMQWLPF